MCAMSLSRAIGGQPGPFDLHPLCAAGDLKNIVTYWNRLCDQVELRRGDDQETPLHVTARLGHHDVMSYLLTKHVNINARDVHGRTPLHLAALNSQPECELLLVKHGAKVDAQDNARKTPLDVAHGSLLRLVIGEDIKDTEITAPMLSRALMAAARTDDTAVIGKLVLLSSAGIDQALKEAIDLRRHKAQAMLLMLQAASTGRVATVQNLFGIFKLGSLRLPSEVLLAARRDVSTSVPLRIAADNHHWAVYEELLVHTETDKEAGKVAWDGLGLDHLDADWLRRLLWVQHLSVANNKLTNLPGEIIFYVKNLTKLELQHNLLTRIPSALLQLPSVVWLNLSHNRITQLPNVKQCSSSLTWLSLAHNLLEDLPHELQAPSAKTLDLSHNRLLQVPFCLTSFPLLEELKLSHNVQITVLPVWLCRLTFLKKLGLKGLPNLLEPPRDTIEDLSSTLKYLHTKLSRTKPVREMKVVVAGESRTGKSSVVACLAGNSPGRPLPPTEGVSITHWLHHESSATDEFEFNIWELGGGQSCYHLHELLYSRSCMYLLVFNLLGGCQAVERVRFWLDGISRRSRGSTVVMVGTHLDCLGHQDCRLDVLRDIQAAVLRLRDDYGSIVSFSSEPFIHLAAAEGKSENVHVLQKVVFDLAAGYRCRDGHPFMGRRVLLSAVGLRGEIEDYRRLVQRGEKLPLFNQSEMRAIAGKLKDLQVLQDKELQEIVSFLNEVGAIVHYNKFGPDIEDVFFLDPNWLFVRVADALQCHSQQPPVVLNKETVARELRDHAYHTLTVAPVVEVIECFRIVTLIGEHWYLVPSRLLSEKPSCVISPLDTGTACYQRLYTLRNVSPANIGLTLVREVVAKIPLLSACFPRATAECSNASSSGNLMLWRDGIFFQDGPLTLLIEASSSNGRKKIGVVVSSADGAKELFCQVADLMPQVCADAAISIPCPKCQETPPPSSGTTHHFSWESCVHAISRGIRHVATHPETNPHAVDMEILAPDLLLLDLSKDFVLSHVILEKQLKPTPLHVLYQGKYRHRPVVVAHFEYLSEEAFRQIRAEAGLVRGDEFHPCISSPLGLCIQTTAALVAYEEPPLGVLFWILHKGRDIPRLVVCRMAVQIIEALRFLHRCGVAPLLLQPSLVLVWSLSAQALCHCKLSRSMINDTLQPLTAKLAAENMDQLGSLIFELVCQRKLPVEFDPSLLHSQCCQDVMSRGYFYLARTMLSCWSKARNFLSDSLVTELSSFHAQSLLRAGSSGASAPVSEACPVAVSNSGQGGEVWFCCRNRESASLEVHTVNISDLSCTVLEERLLKGREVQCMRPCRGNVWFATRMEDIGVISIIGVASRDLLHSIKMKNNYITCMGCTDTAVYMGTHAGFLFAFDSNVQALKSGLKPRHKYVSDSSIAGIVVVKQHIWVSHSRHIYLVDPETLEFKSICQRTGTGDLANADVGRLQLSLNESLIFSACISGKVVSSWDVAEKVHLGDIRIEDHLDRVLGANFTASSAKDVTITSFAAGLDEVWVGTSTGHIVAFSDGALATWMQPYQREVTFLCPVFEPTLGSFAIAAGGKGYRLLPPEEPKLQQPDSTILSLWAMFPAKTMRQMKAVEETQGGYLLSYEAMARTIKENSFIDATLVCEHPSIKPPLDDTSQES